ncbi:MAG: response regulator transcription factor [Egibacteraceae bacterium]
MSIRVLVCEDDSIMRAGLRALLEREDDVEVVGEAPGGDEALEVAVRLRPDVVLLSSSRPGLDSMRLPREIKAILLASPHHHDVLGVLSAGFRGVLSAGGSPYELLHAIRLVAAGDAFVAPATICSLFGDLKLSQAETDPGLPEEFDALTPREREVLQLLTRGSSNREIAGELSLSGATVRSHINHLLAKLGLQSRTQAVAYAYENGFVPFANKNPGRFAAV